MALRVLIDTNVLVDFMAQRKPFDAEAVKIVNAGKQLLFHGCIAAHSVPDIYYILRKSIPPDERREVLQKLCEIFTVIGIDKNKLSTALKNEEFTDFEDCLQSLCAAEFHADYIVTRNPKDYVLSDIPAIAPDVFCQRFLNEEDQ